MTNQRKKILEELFESFQMIRRKMICSKKMNRRHHITPSQWMVVRIIDQQQKSTVKEVAKMLSISSSAATQLIDGLVKEGYIMRKESEEDRRSIILTLSPKTTEKLAEMKMEATEQLFEIFKALTDEELNLYAKLNKKVTSKL